jgi:HK97 family phage prohead protease
MGDAVGVQAVMTLAAAPEDQIRSFEAMDLDVKPDGLVEGLIVPWMRPTEVVETIGDRPVSYREQFARGSLDRAMRAPGRVGLAFGHSDRFADRLGFGISLRDSEEGAVMEWQLYRSTMDKAMDVLGSSHRGLSMTFRTLRPQYGVQERDGALVTREQVHLRYVAATDCPAYEDAQVLALRDRAAELEAEQQAQREKEARQVQLLLFLQEQGRDLSPRQLEYLEQHRGQLPVS